MKPLGFVLLIITSMALSACTPTVSTSEMEVNKDKLIPVKTVAVEEVKLEHTTTQPATVRPFYQAEIQARVSGYVEEVKVDIGDPVKENQVLAILSIPEMKKQVAVMNSKIKRYQALETQALAGIELAKADIVSSQAQFTQAKSELNRVAASLAAAEAEFQRTEDLVQRQSLAPRVLDEVRKKRDSEKAALEAVKSSILSAEANVTVSQARQAAAEADLSVAKADTKIAQSELEELNVMIEYGVLKAPFAGVVTARSIDPGDLVRNLESSKSGHSLFVISQISTVRVQIPIPEIDAVRVNRGDQVTLSFPFYKDEPEIKGLVSRLTQSLDSHSGTMLIEVDIDNAKGKLLPGMFGQASINLSTKVASHTLPARAVRFTEAGEAYVYVLDKDKTVSVIDVKTGFDDGNTIEIVSGVETGQDVIDAHRERFTNGQKVNVLQD
ncbi:MAG: efflux RND transporter periplasmic adaptor subunit [Planctomycetaceae bacterium]|nr:efflux RND transporter periplasmic adaptor subunit [bacterium]MDC0307756.1 efflux RND transporter periplasmic adaptor subunit [Planctomycetaceae bacterium]MDG2388049.1 efflux RND transporter periplasmic adaptor subunit [Planctomycetaceae bacterium]